MKPAIETKTEEVCHLKVGDFVTFDYSEGGYSRRNILAFLTRGNHKEMVVEGVPQGYWWQKASVVGNDLTMEEFHELFPDRFTNITILEPHEVPAAIAKALNVPLPASPTSSDAPSDKGRERYFVSIDEKGNKDMCDKYWVISPIAEITVIYQSGESRRSCRSVPQMLDILGKPNGFLEVSAPPF